MSLLMVRWSTALCRSSTASPRTIIERPRWSATSDQHRAGSLLRAGADRGCSSRLFRRVWAPDVCQAPGPRYLGARARHRPRRGVGYQFVSSVSPSLCSTFFSRVSQALRTPLHSATS